MKIVFNLIKSFEIKEWIKNIHNAGNRRSQMTIQIHGKRPTKVAYIFIYISAQKNTFKFFDSFFYTWCRLSLDRVLKFFCYFCEAIYVQL